MTLLAPVTIEGVNLDDEPGCDDAGWVDGPDTDCPKPARWQYRGTCGHPWLLCDEHADELREVAGGAICTCGNRTPSNHINWRHL